MDKEEQEEMENNRIVTLCYKHLDKFNYINYQDGLPENVKLTVFCKGSEDEGFLINLASDELGLEALIVRKWIIHSEFEALVGHKI